MRHYQSATWTNWLDRSDVFIVDTETTGLGDSAEVIEVAVLDTTGTVRYEALSLPVGRIPRAVVDVHGLSHAKLKAAGARPWPAVHGELVAALKGAAVVLAWNAPFDRRLLAQTASRHGLKTLLLPWHDLLADYRAMTRGEIRVGGSLATAVKRSGAVTDEPAHRAAGDCRRVLAVMRAMSGNLPHKRGKRR